MEISNVCTPYSFDSVECRKNSGEKALSKESSGQVERIGEGEYRFLNRDSSFRFHFQDAQYQKQIEDMFARNYSNVVILHPINAESLTLDMRFFPAAYRTGQIEILVPEHIRQALVQHGEPDNLNRLAQRFLFDDGLHTGFLFSRGKHQDEADYEESKAADEKNKKTGKPNTKENPDIKENSGESKDEVKGKTGTEEFQAEEEDQSFSELVKEGSLRLYGDKFDMLVNIERVGTEERVSAYRLIFHRKPPEGLLVKGIGTLSFSDTKSFITASVRQRLKETPNYLNSWDAYAAKEGNFLLNKARNIGRITCGATYNREEDAYVFSVMGAGEECLKQFSLLKAGEKDGDVLQCTEDVPVYLNLDIDWNRYEKDLEARENEERMKRKSGVELPEPPVLFRVIKRPASPSDSILKLSLLRGNMPEGSGRPFHFIYSIYGDERQISRRREARERIKEGRASMPSLGLILGGDFSASDYDLSSGIRGKKIAPLSPLVREKIFDNPPTEHQVRAIEIALNTPDIAVIQGPPGTGKTTVIRAIIERLNEISDKQNLAPGQVLVTSLQHDAVNNLVERLSINSLPTIKFGRKQSESQEDLGTAVRQWCENVASELEKKHDFLHETEDQAKLTRLFNQYFLMPDDVRAREFLEKARLFSTSAISEEFETILQDLPAVPSLDDQRTLLAKIYQLPVTAEGLSDHGAQRAEELLFELEERFGEDFGSKDTAGTAWQKQVRNILEKVINGMDDCALAEDLPRIRRELLGRFIPRPILQRPEPRKDIIHVYQKVHQLMTQPKEAMHMAIYEFYEELSSGSKAVEEALASYTFAFAATAQQSEGKEIKRAKNVKKPKEVKSHASYNTVIVDEAARVAPGDLMIPLSQAERRIILVGDQKQLPHIYDEEIFEKLREEGKLVSDDDIRESMFEHLWNIAKELEKHDHIPRTITLDKQYRTHPELGNFVSQNFYEADGEGFESPRKAEEFKQSITPHACIWVNLPDAKGTMQRRANGSKTREVEADYIVSEIDEYLKRPDCQGLSFGVITFYSSQRELVKQKLRKHGISPDNNDRLRVGTVDEFQGMEFDVIFLSVVRSVRSFAKEDLEKLLSSEGAADEYKKEKEQLTIKYYGFLNDNRLCVALSRQKRLLIVVGNGDMFSGRSGAPLAKRCVTAMYNLYARCESEGGVIDG